MPLSIRFVDFWPGFNFRSPKESLFRAIVDRYQLVEDTSDAPHILVYSIFGQAHRDARYDNAIKVFYSAENPLRNQRPSLELLDHGVFTLTMEKIDHPNHCRVPNILRAGWHGTGGLPFLDENLLNIPDKKKFCLFVARNPKGQERNAFVKKLMAYKHVDCPGLVFNNMTIPGDKRMVNNDKLAEPYKFCIAYENSSYPGYCTEKIWWGFLGRSIPIYWGDPDVGQDFYPGSFLSRHDFQSDEALINEIRRLDQDDDAYRRILTSPKVRNRDLFSDDRIVDFFVNVVVKARIQQR